MRKDIHKLEQHKNKLCNLRTIYGHDPDRQDSIFVYVEGEICIGFGRFGLLQRITGTCLGDIHDTF